MTNFVPVNEPLLNGNELKYVSECVKTGWISSEGAYVERFEREFAEFVDRKFGVAVSNGTAAIDIAIASLEFSPGDEIIVPTFTIISCVHQILRSGLVPIFVDCDSRTFNMQIMDVEAAITEKTRAVMAVHIYGLTVDMDPLLRIANKYNLYVIEDAAEAHGNRYKNVKCGSIGDLSTFSFYPNKHITTVEGGMVLTDDESIYKKLKQLRNLCFNEDRFVHSEIGWNYRMTNLQAALGVAQLERIDEKLERKKTLGFLYNQGLANLPNILLPIKATSYCENNYWVYPILLKEGSALDRKQFMTKLADLGVGTRPMFYPMHLQPVLKKFGIKSSGNFINSENVYKHGLYIPSGVGTTRSQQLYVIDSITKILTEKEK